MRRTGVRTLQTEYRDSEGRLVAKSTVTGNENPRFTCYAYDELGRLRYVIPPIVHEQIKGLQMSITPASASYKKYWYYYEYDRYGRTVVASKPGKADEYFVYDKQGRMVPARTAICALRTPGFTTSTIRRTGC